MFISNVIAQVNGFTNEFSKLCLPLTRKPATSNMILLILHLF